MAFDDNKMARYIELAVRIGVVFAILYLVVRIIAPFVPAITWAVILAVATYPFYRWLVRVLGNRENTAAVVLTVLALVLIIAPATWLGQSLIDWGTSIAGRIADGTLTIPPPPDRVAEWPLIGEQVHDLWALASSNLSEALSSVESQLRGAAEWLLKSVAGVGLGILQFAFSIIIAGVMLANAQKGTSFATRLFERLIPESGESYVKLSEQTIRSVAVGVIGVALIQGALIGVGFLVMGIPGAAILIIAVVLLGIVQLPATLITVPVILWVWGSYETVPALIFTLYVVPAGLADNVLKPILLGRGVEAPMLIIFVGAIGGFILSGIVGLFIGAVILVLAYQLFQAWLNVVPVPAAGAAADVVDKA